MAIELSTNSHDLWLPDGSPAPTRVAPLVFPKFPKALFLNGGWDLYFPTQTLLFKEAFAINDEGDGLRNPTLDELRIASFGWVAKQYQNPAEAVLATWELLLKHSQEVSEKINHALELPPKQRQIVIGAFLDVVMGHEIYQGIKYDTYPLIIDRDPTTIAWLYEHKFHSPLPAGFEAA